jgi:ATP-dependent Clp protease adaptor protein ClpS
MDKEDTFQIPEFGIETFTKTEEETKTLPMWHVIILNDEEHTYQYVISLIQEVFKLDKEKAFQLTFKIDKEGQAICATCSKERAELYQQQVKSWGIDPLMILSGKKSTGSIACVIEPAE